jgi:hypothetical protein
MVIGRVVHEGTGFDKESLNRFMKMIVTTMGANSDFKELKRNFLTFMFLKVAYLYGSPESCSMFHKPVRTPCCGTLPAKTSPPTRLSSASMLLARTAPLPLGTSCANV